MPGAITRRGGNRRAHIGPGADHGIPERHPLRQACRHRTRQRTARAMGVARLNPPVAEDFHPRAGGEQIHHLIPRQMPALQQHGFGAECQQRLGRLVHGADIGDGEAAKRLGFRM